MQFNLHPTSPLSLAILVAILGGTHTSAVAVPAWNCKQYAGQWDCSAATTAATLANFRQPLGATFIPLKDEPIQPLPTKPLLVSKATRNNKSSRLRKRITRKKVTTQTQPIAPPTNTTSNTQSQIDFKKMDWYPYTSDNNHGVCKGRYISPVISANTDPESNSVDLSTVFISADQSATELGQSSVLKGNVDIRQGNRSLNSPLVRLNQETGALSLEGGVIYRQTGMLITADSAQGNINNDETTMHNAQYVIHDKDLRGDAQTIVRKTKNVLDIKNGSLTFCPPGTDAWKISASNINLDIESGFGRADNAKLVIMGTPVLYLPYFYFPIDDRRHSGFLYPSLKISDDVSKISIPYYFNIAPNIDDTLTATFNSNKSLLVENEVRYLDKNSSNRLSTSLNVVDSADKRNRWVLGANHSGEYGRFNTAINYTKVSDNDYFSDFGTNLDVDDGDNSHLNQTAKISFQADNWNSSILIQKYQTIDSSQTKPYQRLPEIRLTGTAPDPWDNISFNYRTVFTRFDRDQTGLSDSQKVNGDRLIINPSVNIEINRTWGYLKPSFKLWHSSYSLNDQDSSIGSHQSTTLPILEVDSGLYFDRDFEFQSKAYTQTLEPRLYALYVPYQDQSTLPDFDTSELTFTYNSLFRDNRFSGDDRFGDAKQLSLGLTSRVISDEGREIVSASIGHAIYFDDRKVRVDANAEPIDNDTSDFASSIIWRPNSRVRALFDATFDAKTLQNSELTLDLKYEEDPNHVIGIRHRFTRDTRKQTTLSYLWPISNNWSSLGLLQYDWLTRKPLDAASGLEYASCCWKTRIVARSQNSGTNRENSIALQFVLKGLGGIGKSITSELSDKIKCYQKREYFNANN